jgi:hypothetical protein
MNPSTPSDATRTCPCCAETIRATARVCPRCRQWLSWRSIRHPFVSASVLTVASAAFFLVVAFGLLRTFHRLLNGPPYYAEFLGSLRVLESRLNWVQTQQGPRIYVTGLLTNSSPIAWKEVELECRFYDSASNLVDAANARSFLTIHAHDDAAFRATVVPGVSSNQHGSFRISVSTARNGKSIF